MDEAERGSKMLGGKRSNSGGSPSTMRGVAANPLFGGYSQHSPQYSNMLSLNGTSTDRPLNRKFINTQNQQQYGGGSPAMTPHITRMSKSVVGGPLSETSTIIQGSTGGGQSTMIEREKRALEKIKLRQKKDIE
jgi:hypothetical protein